MIGAFRGFAILLSAFSLMIGAAGCTVRASGITGITVDGKGHLMVALAWCGRSPDGIIIYHDLPNGQTMRDADYIAPKLIGNSATVRLDAPSAGWKVQGEAHGLHDSTTYHAYGYTSDSKSSTVPVRFGLADSGRIAQDVVLMQNYDEASNDEMDIVVTRDEFNRQGIQMCKSK